MSWRTGSSIFTDIWPIIQYRIKDRDQRIEFTAQLIQLFARNDMDTWDIEDVDPEIREAMRHVGIEISEPDRYDD